MLILSVMVIVDFGPNFQKTHLNVQVLQIYIIIWQKKSLNKRL
jgi:hypothetical protein